MVISRNTKSVAGTIVAGCMVIALGAGLCVGSKVSPWETDYTSGNGRFIAHVTPAKGIGKRRTTDALIQVYENKDGNRIALWSFVTSDGNTPEEAFVSDDGTYVVTKNEYWMGANGEYVLAFYRKEGLIRHYSREQVLGYPEKITKEEFNRLMYGFLGDPEWADTAFVREVEGRQLFFAWLGQGYRWMAWDAATGDEVEVTLSLVSSFDKLAWQWASQALVGREPQVVPEWYKAVEFRRGRGESEDRKLIESLLGADDYATSYSQRTPDFQGYHAFSPKRDSAERVLVEWDGLPLAGSTSGAPQKYRHLGTIRGTIVLPSAPTATRDNWLCLYLLPESSRRKDWYSEIPVHRFTVEFATPKDLWPDKSVPFMVCGVTPGRYYLKAIWDCSSPNTLRRDSISGPPSPGDYENGLAPRVDVTAGGEVKDIAIDCMQKVDEDSVTLWSSEVVPSTRVDEPPCPCGKEHGQNRVCIVFDKPLPLNKSLPGLYFYSGPTQVRTEGANTIYEYVFEKVGSDPNHPRNREFDMRLQTVATQGRLACVTVEGPYFSLVPLGALLRRLASAVNVRTSDLVGQSRIYGGPIRLMNPQQVPLSKAIRLLGEPSERRADEAVFTYWLKGATKTDGQYWVKYTVTKEELIVRDSTNLLGVSSFLKW